MPVWLPWSVLVWVCVALAGAYYDVWWHVRGLVETFFTIPHAILYAGIFFAGMSVLAHVVYQMIEMRRFAPARIPHARALAMAGTGSLLQLIAGVSDEYYHRLFGFDITMWSPPHLLAVFGGVFLALGLAGMFWALPKSRLRTLGYTAALGLSASVFLYGLIEYSIAAEWALDLRWRPYPAFYPLAVGLFGSYLLSYASRQSGLKVGASVFGWALIVQLIAYLAWAPTPANMRIPILFFAAGIVFDLVAVLGERKRVRAPEYLAGIAFSAACVVLVSLQAPIQIGLRTTLLTLLAAAALARICVWIGLRNAESGVHLPQGSGRTVAARIVLIFAFFMVSAPAYAHQGHEHASTYAPDLHPAFVALEFIAVFAIGFAMAGRLASIGRDP